MRKSSQKSLKPLLEVGQPVFSAYWPPDDPDREAEPEWYPGIITHYKVSKLADDDKYDYIRYYSVRFDDGDVMRDVCDHFVMPASEYLLHLRHEDVEGHKWLGVRNVVDRNSGDYWAKHVGWYVATFDDEEHTFSLLSDALRAYDSSVVRNKGVEGVRKEDLNLPEDWKELFAVQKKMNSNDAKKKAAALADATLAGACRLYQPLEFLRPTDFVAAHRLADVLGGRHTRTLVRPGPASRLHCRK